jgi:hypothetical protein
VGYFRVVLGRGLRVHALLASQLAQVVRLVVGIRRAQVRIIRFFFDVFEQAIRAAGI